MKYLNEKKINLTHYQIIYLFNNSNFVDEFIKFCNIKTWNNYVPFGILVQEDDINDIKYKDRPMYINNTNPNFIILNTEIDPPPLLDGVMDIDGALLPLSYNGAKFGKIDKIGIDFIKTMDKVLEGDRIIDVLHKTQLEDDTIKELISQPPTSTSPPPAPTSAPPPPKPTSAPVVSSSGPSTSPPPNQPPPPLKLKSTSPSPNSASSPSSDPSTSNSSSSPPPPPPSKSKSTSTSTPSDPSTSAAPPSPPSTPKPSAPSSNPSTSTSNSTSNPSSGPSTPAPLTKLTAMEIFTLSRNTDKASHKKVCEHQILTQNELNTRYEQIISDNTSKLNNLKLSTVDKNRARGSIPRNTSILAEGKKTLKKLTEELNRLNN